MLSTADRISFAQSCSPNPYIVTRSTTALRARFRPSEGNPLTGSVNATESARSLLRMNGPGEAVAAAGAKPKAVASAPRAR